MNQKRTKCENAQILRNILQSIGGMIFTAGVLAILWGIIYLIFGSFFDSNYEMVTTTNGILKYTSYCLITLLFSMQDFIAESIFEDEFN